MTNSDDVYITSASFGLTRSCNLRCSYPCFTHGCTSGSMSWATAKRSVEFLLDNAVKVKHARAVDIAFWGGEPLLEWDLLQKIVVYAEQLGEAMSVPVTFGGTTNGTLLTPEKFDFLDEHKVLFMVSFDGTKETHDLHRKFVNGDGSHDVVLANLKHALKRWPFYRVRMSPTTERISNFYEDMKYIFELGVNHIMFSPAYESNFTEEHWKIFEEQSCKLIDYMAEQRRAGRELEVEHFRSYVAPDNSKYPCGAGRHYVHINHEGYIFACHRFEKFDDHRPYMEREFCLGDVRHGIVKHGVRDMFINFSPVCKGGSCWGTNVCWGGCYAVNYDLTGDIRKAPESVCNYVKAQTNISKYYAKVLGVTKGNRSGNCICDFSYYTGPVEPAHQPVLSFEEKRLMGAMFVDIGKRLQAIESRLERLENGRKEA